VVVIVRALYGLKTAGASWHAHLGDTLRSLGFTSSYADHDVWLRAAVDNDGKPYYEYVVVYVDDLLIVSYDHASIFAALGEKYVINPTSGRYLGTKVDTFTVAKDTSDEREAWYMTAEEYLKHALKIVEDKYPPQSKKTVDAPLLIGYHPEIDETPYLDDSEANYYQSLIGILMWVVELGRIDVAYAVGTLSRFSAMPRQGHLQGVLRIFSYLRDHRRSRLVLDPKVQDWSDFEITAYDWEAQYPDAKETLPPNMPEPRGKPIQTTFFVDAAHATDLATRRSVSGILLYCNSAPIRWYSKRQNTVEASAYGSEFVAMRIAVELVEALRYKLRMFGAPIDGPTTGFCDNQSVVLNSTIPSSTLKKKHNSIAYHKTREAIAAGYVNIVKEPTETNLADILTKPLSGPRTKFLSSHIMF
ncbi:MAG: reverse transcriptase domain-containing protein, partial [Bacteroidota bacterium]